MCPSFLSFFLSTWLLVQPVRMLSSGIREESEQHIVCLRSNCRLSAATAQVKDYFFIKAKKILKSAFLNKTELRVYLLWSCSSGVFFTPMFFSPTREGRRRARAGPVHTDFQPAQPCTLPRAPTLLPHS